MRILISNDDGIHAGGIQTLREALETIGEVIVVAPDRPKSASGHGITVHKPLRAEEVSFPNSSSKGYAVNGTPSDCVKLALEALLNEPPDIIVSGINFGPNLGTDVLYSGTVSAALEGVINGVPAIAISLASYEEEKFGVAGQVAKMLVQRVVEKGLPEETLLNVNVPLAEKEDLTGFTITKLGRRRYKNTFQKRKDPRGKEYFWMGGEAIDLAGDPDTDINTVKRNEVSITPIIFDVTNHHLMDCLKDWNLKL